MTAREDNMAILLDGKEVFTVSEYRVTYGVFEQPGAFEMVIGHPGMFRYFTEAYPPGTPYSIYLNGRKIQTGKLDGFERRGSQEKTQIKLFGRDVLAPLIDTEIFEERVFSNVTFFELTKQVLEIVGIDPALLVPLNEANRKAVSGVKGAAAVDPDAAIGSAVETGFDENVAESEFGKIASAVVIETIGASGSRAAGRAAGSPFAKLGSAGIDAAGYTPPDFRPTPAAKPKLQFNSITAHVGQSWWDFLLEQYRRFGLFLWATADGMLVLSTPTVEQPSIYRIIRQEDINNVLDDEFRNDLRPRATHYTVYGKTSGGRKGVGKTLGKFVDDECLDFVNRDPGDREAQKYKRHRSIRDQKCANEETANNLARRTCCEDRRRAWSLRYCVQGHTIEAIGTEELAVWTPDTMIGVYDDDFGLYGQIYLEKIDFVGTENRTFTWLTVLRPEDIFFKNEVESTKSVPKKIAPKGINTSVFHPGVYIHKVPGIDSDQDDFFQATGLGKWQGPEDPLDRLEREQKEAEFRQSFDEPSGASTQGPFGPVARR